LIELLVVIAIIAILIGLLVPAVQKVRAAAARSQCQNNLKQLALGVHAYHDVYKGMPQNYGGNGAWNLSGAQWSWVAMILPYIEQGPLYLAAKIGTKVNNLPTTPTNVFVNGSLAAATVIPILRCPSDPDSGTALFSDRADVSGNSVAVSNYKGVAGSNWSWGDGRWNPGWQANAPNQNGLDAGNGIFWRSSGTPSMGYARKITLVGITDGSSNTFLIGESLPSRCLWTGAWVYANNVTGTCAIYPNATQTNGAQFSNGDWPDCYSFHSSHTGGLQFAMADGSVKFVTNDIAIATYRGLATIAGGETVTVPD
jgi:prepilin-type processing-associated H-X9-DG protein